jgi:cytochrome c oxidase cbb3-type subunit 4
MDTYSLLRQIADSWVLLAMFLFFVGVIVWAFRPGSRAIHAETSQIPFRNEDRPGTAENTTGSNGVSSKTEELQS